MKSLGAHTGSNLADSDSTSESSSRPCGEAMRRATQTSNQRAALPRQTQISFREPLLTFADGKINSALHKSLSLLVVHSLLVRLCFLPPFFLDTCPQGSAFSTLPILYLSYGIFCVRVEHPLRLLILCMEVADFDERSRSAVGLVLSFDLEKQACLTSTASRSHTWCLLISMCPALFSSYPKRAAELLCQANTTTTSSSQVRTDETGELVLG